MPTLADIYSMIDSAKRRAGDVLKNPYISAQQMLGNANDRARVFNELNDAALDEFRATGDLYGPKGKELAQSLAGAYNPVGMTVYHGSPHVFERFDLSKMGTGEGNQAYGRGMYVAQNPEVAKSYAVDAANQTPQKMFAPKTNVNQNAIDYFQAMLEGKVPRDLKENVPVSDEYIKSQISQLSEKLPSLYKVDLPDTHIRRMLDWDEPLKNQPAQVRKLAKSLGMDLNDLGGDLLAKVGKGDEGRQILEKAGIRGVKYLDQMSRDKQKGTKNFVVFDPNHLTILERNNQPIK